MEKKVFKKKVSRSDAERKRAAIAAEYKAKVHKTETEPQEPAKKLSPANEEILRKAELAKAGDVSAMVWLWKKYEAIHKKRNDEKYLKARNQWLKKAASAGDANSMYTLSAWLMRGNGMEKDPAQAMYWMEKNAEKDPVTGNFWLGKYYAQGDPVPKDVPRAVQYLKKAIAAEPKNEEQKYLRAWGKFTLAEIYLMDSSVPKEETARLIRESSEEGYETASLYRKLFGDSAPSFGSLMKTALRSAATGGWSVNEIMEDSFGSGIDGFYELMRAEPDAGSFGKLIGQAGEKMILKEETRESRYLVSSDRNREALSDLTGIFAAFTETGDISELVKLAESMTKFIPAEQFPLLYTLKAFAGEDLSDPEIISLLKKAADLKEGYACLMLGVFYMTGEKVQADQEKAVQYLRTAADQDIADAYAYLAHQYYFGLGVRGDASEAIRLLKQTDLYMDEDTCEKIEDGLKGLYRGRKTMKDVYPFFFLRDDTPVIADAVISSAGRRYVDETMRRMTDEKFGSIMAKLDLLQTIALDTNVRTRSIENSLDEMNRYIRHDLSNLLQEEKRMLANAYGDEEKMNRFFAKVTSLINEKTKTADDLVAEQTEKLRKMLKDVFEEMLEDSRSSLVSAFVLWNGCENITDESFDYSGICICATAAFEGEAKRIFFTDYLNYMQETGVPEEEIEYIRKKAARTGTFTLGSLPFVFGIHNKQTNSEKQKMQEHLIPFLQNTVKDSAGSVIAQFSDGTDTCLLNRSEDIRENYRNKAAHTASLSRETAKACMEAVTDALSTMMHMFDPAKI